MHARDEPLELGDGGGRYRVVRVEPAPNRQAFGHASAERRNDYTVPRPKSSGAGRLHLAGLFAHLGGEWAGRELSL